MPAIHLEILSLVPTSYNQCPHCETLYSQSGIGKKVHQEIIMQGYPPDMMEEYLRLSEWVTELSYRYGSQIAIRVIDPQSSLGLWKALRYWVRKYPTFIVNGKEKYTGWDKDALEKILRNALQ